MSYQLPPVLFAIFANENDDYLCYLSLEAKEVKKIIRPLYAQNRIQTEFLSHIEAPDVSDIFRTYKGRIKIFHYSGHANGEHLKAGGEKAYLEGLAQFIIREHKEAGVKLVFLNGCETYAITSKLLAAGIEAVITTTKEVNDERAKDFSVEFYKNLVDGQNIGTAYQNATNYLKTRYDISDKEQPEIYYWKPENQEKGVEKIDVNLFTWGLYVRSQEAEKQVLFDDNVDEEQVIVPDITLKIVRAGRKKTWKQYFHCFNKENFSNLEMLTDGSQVSLDELKKGIKYYQDVYTDKDCLEELRIQGGSAVHYDLTGHKEISDYEVMKHPIYKILAEYFVKISGVIPLLLADAGMGKTLNMQKSFIALLNKRKFNNYNLVFIRCGRYTDEYLDKLAEDIDNKERERTIVFLDAFDEDTKARQLKKVMDRNNRFERILKRLNRYHKAYISCRPQFWESEKNIRTKFKGISTQVLKIKVQKLSEIGIKTFIEKTVASEFRNNYKQIALSNTVLFGRPLHLKTLTYIAEVGKDVNIALRTQLYDQLIKGWIRRAIKREDISLDEKEEEMWKEKLKEEAMQVAIRKCKNQDAKFTASDLRSWAKFSSNNILDNSFFTVYEQTEYKGGIVKQKKVSEYYDFAHQEFYEYFLSEALFLVRMAEEEFEKFASEKVGVKELLKQRYYIEYFGITNQKQLEDFKLEKYFKKQGIAPEATQLLIDIDSYRLQVLAYLLAVNKSKKITDYIHYAYNVVEKLYEWTVETSETDEDKKWLINPLFDTYNKVKEWQDKKFDTLPELKNIKGWEQQFLCELATKALLEDNDKNTYLKIAKLYAYDLAAILEQACATNSVLKKYLKSDKIERLDFSRIKLQKTDWIQYFEVWNLKAVDISHNHIEVQLGNLPPEERKADYYEQKFAPLMPFLDKPNENMAAPSNFEEFYIEGNPICKDTHIEKVFQKDKKINVLWILRAALLLRWVKGTAHTKEKYFEMGQDTLDSFTDPYKGKEVSLLAERPVHKVSVGDFAIGKYPLTLGMFRTFIDDEGYETTAEKGDKAILKAYKLAEQILRTDFELPVPTEDDKTCPGSLVTVGIKRNDVIILYTQKWANGCCWKHSGRGLRGENNNWIPHEELDAWKPVVHISWHDAKEYADWLKRKTGVDFQLPSEAAWEYAARGGVYWKDGYEYAGGDDLDKVGWYSGNLTVEALQSDSEQEEFEIKELNTKVVGLKKPNQLGIYDMSGNVFEWCEDDWHSNYEGAPSDGSAWVDNPRAEFRLLRGGSWRYNPGHCRVANRDYNLPDDRSNGGGCRLFALPVV
ncbi:MAG: SUMF1/EgtB/PvdO family nonheme iron enzyme [Bernardetiaceae bacterium]|nr:SUMF1/EgtB/PvdO family nonheme iron enzyme [Bernardetiaceae bacterium]